MGLTFNRNLKIISGVSSAAVERALDVLRRDIQKTCKETEEPGQNCILSREYLIMSASCSLRIKKKTG